MQVRCQNSSRCRAGESTDDDSEFNQIRAGPPNSEKDNLWCKVYLDLNWQFGSYDNFCDSRMVITSILVSFNFLSFFARISTGS